MPFDAKSLLESVIAGNAQSPAPSQADLSSILSQALQAGQGGAGAATGLGGLGGILGQVLGGAGAQGGLGGMLGQAAAPGGLGGALGQVLGGAGAAGGLGAVLNQVLGGAGGAQGGLAGAADIARSIFGNATQGVQDATRQVNQQTGAGPQLDQIIRQISGGQGAGDLVAKAQEIIKNNPGLAGALAGALGTLVVGSGSGRTIAAHAAKLGGLVLIGGLAYKAYENYKAGQSTSASASAPPSPAPAGTGFEPQAQTNDSATLYLRAMIAAAAADGVVDEGERTRIAAGLQQAGHSADAAAFLAKELATPASVAQLAAGATSPEVAAQTYTAARVAIEPHSDGEKTFLAQLAAALKLDPGLVAHIDAAASANKV